MVFHKCLIILAVWCVASSQAVPETGPLTSGIKMLRRIYDHCEKSEEIVKCLKVQAVKIADRAIKTENITLMDGFAVVKRKDAEIAEGPRFLKSKEISDEEVRSMSSDQLDSVLAEKTAKFFNTHQVSMSMARLLSSSNGKENLGGMIEEGRGKLKKYIGPILTAIAIKGGFIAMAFQAIAMISGKALLIGKIALVLSAIIGLKKLVSGDEAHEKTTYEIVKHPQVSQSHSYSSSHYGGGGGGGGGGEYEATGPGGHYRSLNDDIKPQERAFRAHVPRS